MVVDGGAGDCSVAGSSQSRSSKPDECARSSPAEIGVGAVRKTCLSLPAFEWLRDLTETSKRSDPAIASQERKLENAGSCTRRALSGLGIRHPESTLLEPVASFPATLSNSSVALACTALTGAYSREPLGTGPIRQGWRSLASGLTAVCLLQETCEFLDQQHCVDRFRQVSVHRGRGQKEEIEATPHSCR